MEFFVRVGRSEALGIFRKWSSERIVLRCFLTFPRFTVCFRGRVFSISDESIGVVSDDASSEMALQLGAEMQFDYTEELHPEDCASYRSMLIVFFGPVLSRGQPDMIAFSEIKQIPVQ